MIVLFTDFGLEGPYIGQVKAVLHERAPGIPAVDLFSDLPPFNARAAAYLLAAYAPAFPTDSVFLAVVDPGVGSDRAALVAEIEGRWYVGPDNGLFGPLLSRAQAARVWQAEWRPEALSASFHGRDLFAPIAAQIAVGQRPPASCRALTPPFSLVGLGDGWPADLVEVVYLDRFGNAITGLRASQLSASKPLSVGGRTIRQARTFSEVAKSEAFWYENANGLVEIAANQASAADLLGLSVGDPVSVGIE